MASSQGRSSDDCRQNVSIVYVSATTKAEAVAKGFAADVQPRCSPLACALLDATAP